MATTRSRNLTVFLLLLVSLATARSLSNKPIIKPAEPEQLLKWGEDLKMECKSNEPITWTYFPNDEYNNIDIGSKVYTNLFESPDKDFRYNAILHIENASFADVRFYYCHPNKTHYTNELRTSKFYLYVDDPNHLSVIPVGEFKMVEIMQHRSGYLPCRPTFPDIQVDLFDFASGEQSYDPRHGILINYDDEIANHNLIICTFEKGEQSEQLSVVLQHHPYRNEIEMPHIEDLNKNQTTVGGTLKLKCSVSIEGTGITSKWILPNPNAIYEATPLRNEDYSMKTHWTILKVFNVTKKDAGQYSCEISDTHENNAANQINVYIYGEKENFVKLYEEHNLFSIPATVGNDSIQYTVVVSAHPPATVVWRNKENETISNSDKYEISETDNLYRRVTLKIKNIAINDRGNYTVQAFNSYENIFLSFFLNVTDKPSTQIISPIYHMFNEYVIITCEVAGYPQPQITWIYTQCLAENCSEVTKTGRLVAKNGLVFVSQFNLTAHYSGWITCMAKNGLGIASDKKPFYVTDVRTGFNIWHNYEEDGYNISGYKNVKIAVEESIELSCGVSKHEYTNKINWFKYIDKQKDTIKLNDRIMISNSNTTYSYRSILKISNSTFDDKGKYVCQVIKSTGEIEEKNIRVFVENPIKPSIASKILQNKEFVMAYSPKLEVDCNVSGIPMPKISWFKDGKDLYSLIDDKRIRLEQNGQLLVFEHTNITDEGRYECVAKNKRGESRKYMMLTFNNKPLFDVTTIVLVTILPMVIVVFCIYFYYRRKNTLLQRELKLLGLENFMDGDVKLLNPELTIDEQSELLPYERKYEFPRNKLKLGKQLGSGAFGVVLKAEAYGIVEGEEKTIVAVKMVKRNADNSYIRALASELKILIHLGRHLNVVNLLGACTTNVVKRELLVIVEYCKFGNLHNYLLRHRDSFIDQIDSKTGRIDFNIGMEILERSFSVSTQRSNSHSSNVNYSKVKFKPILNSEDASIQGVTNPEMRDYRGNCNNQDSGTTAVCMAPNPDNDDNSMMTLSNNSQQQPEWRSNYRGDYKGNVRPISTKDLITWSFQVAGGMEYLSSRKVLHGDLAARNILLSDNNIVKICDFGLAKSIYKNDNYKKTGDGLLPVKWMAVESIRDRIFSIQSDVWAFGIVLWEFFSLARTPYPGMAADERLYYKLVDGYRMDSPVYATKEIYQMMLDCWEAKPINRPSFASLVERLGDMLEESVKQHYIDLNDPYLMMNTLRVEEGCSDYLAMLTPPDFEASTSPHKYVNDFNIPEDGGNETGYMFMKPSHHIFSPRTNEDTVFNFDDKHVSPEELPMLQISQATGEKEANPGSPVTPSNGVFNPTYGAAPKVKDIKKSADNYVNMPQNKQSLIQQQDKTEDLSNNQQDVRIDSDYVNSNSRDWERQF